MLDKISIKIMNELCHDGRYSNVVLARKLGFNVATVAKKINAMIEKRIIVIKALPNPSIMGYDSQAFIGLSVDLKKINNVCDRLTKYKHTFMVTTSFGRYDILLIVFFHKKDMLHDFIKGELLRIEGVTRVETYFILEDRRWIERILPDASMETSPILIDEFDKKIIAELMQNGRPNYSDLGKKLGASKSTISRRIALLLKEDVIKILAFPNLSKLGYSANAYVLVNAEHSKIGKICDQLFSYPEVHLVIKLMNNFDILFGIYSENPKTLEEFLQNKIGNMDGILKTETFIRGSYSYFSTHAVFPPYVV